MLELKEKNVLQFGDKKIPYIVTKRPDLKQVHLRLRPDFGLEVNIPSDYQIDVNALLKKKKKWIERKYDDMANSKQIFDGNRVMYRGEYRDVSAIINVQPREALKEWMQNETEKLVKERLAEYARKLKFSSNGFLIRDMKKWAYCGKDGRLVFNWQLAALPKELADYVILHELAHLREFSHSRRFKYVLASFCPDFREREALLKRFISG